MGFAEVLTLILIVLKIFGVISWSWWIVFLPEIAMIAIYVIAFIAGLFALGGSGRRSRNRFRRF
jgi:MFS superfamily sulfate permease-like transporter